MPNFSGHRFQHSSATSSVEIASFCSYNTSRTHPLVVPLRCGVFLAETGDAFIALRIRLLIASGAAGGSGVGFSTGNACGSRVGVIFSILYRLGSV
ncbi:MAG: hypothetical protein IPJ61_20010 [Tessaracoccus sp.]|uniref:hypothetical protein n=1 Tax=Tessaracoccus sp. TaxID=1971211 RepID=UPI001ECA5699|nr:hypothetical protein [Tessaracoccus sp.]MBK7823272.1 hypothetical protein [Tessaracoccus sp.]